MKFHWQTRFPGGLPELTVSFHTIDDQHWFLAEQVGRALMSPSPSQALRDAAWTLGANSSADIAEQELALVLLADHLEIMDARGLVRLPAEAFLRENGWMEILIRTEFSPHFAAKLAAATGRETTTHTIEGRRDG